MFNEQELTNMCIEVCSRVGSSFTVPVKINKRLSRTYGRVKWTRINGYVTSNVIEFSYKFLEAASINSIWDVVEHECAHFLVIKETHEAHGHDKVFKEMCARIGCTNTGATTEIETTVLEDQIYKYFVFCDGCGKLVGKYHRAGKLIQHPEYYSCKCGGTLHVVQNY